MGESFIWNTSRRSYTRSAAPETEAEMARAALGAVFLRHRLRRKVSSRKVAEAVGRLRRREHPGK